MNGFGTHHMQLSVQQQMTALQKFRQHSWKSGWLCRGLGDYSEQLGKGKVGWWFYPDPVSGDTAGLRTEQGVPRSAVLVR